MFDARELQRLVHWGVGMAHGACGLYTLRLSLSRNNAKPIPFFLFLHLALLAAIQSVLHIPPALTGCSSTSHVLHAIVSALSLLLFVIIALLLNLAEVSWMIWGEKGGWFEEGDV